MKNDLPFVTSAVIRSLWRTKRLVEFYYRRISRDEAKSNRQVLFMLPLLPVLQYFPVGGIHPSVDFCGNFRFELMHLLYLEGYRLLEESLVKILSQYEKSTVALQSKQGLPKTYEQVRKRFLHTMNLFLKQVKCDFSDFQNNFEFTKGGPSHNLSGLFSKAS